MPIYSNYNEGLDRLNNIISEFKEFCESGGNVTEADTRMKVINRMLTEVLFWPNTSIKTEPPLIVDGVYYLDYVFTYNLNSSIVIEAKKEGVSFNLPKNINSKRIKIKNLLRDSKSELHKAIMQTWSYCSNNGSEFGITTNGYTWIIFKAITINEKWVEKEAVIFNTLEEISRNFASFWDVLSIDSITNYSLEKHFPSFSLGERESLMDELSKNFDMKNDLFIERLVDRVEKYNGKELPLAKPIFSSNNYCEECKKFYFGGEEYSWLQPRYRYKGVVRLNINQLYLQIDKNTAGLIFEDRDNFELTGTLSTKDNLVFFNNLLLKHKYKNITFQVNGILNSYPRDTVKISEECIVGLNIDPISKRVCIITESGEIYFYNYFNNNIEEKFNLTLEKKRVITDSVISNDSKNIIVFLSDGNINLCILSQNTLQTQSLSEAFPGLRDLKFINNKEIVVKTNDSVAIIDIKTKDYKPIIKSKKRLLSMFFNQYIDIAVNEQDNLLGIVSKDSIMIMDLGSMHTIHNIYYYELNYSIVEKIVYLCKEYILFKYKNNDGYLYKIRFLDRKKDIEKITLLGGGRLINSASLGDCNYLLIASHQYSLEMNLVPNLKCVNIVEAENHYFGNTHFDIKSPITKLVYSIRDNILVSAHLSGEIILWKIKGE